MSLDNEPCIESQNSKNIQAISRDTVHKICSGQVVFNLAIAVKELVENAIDAGATSIDVRLKEYGSELVEVSDNGTGVEECNFSALTMKHCTSKLREFTDLEAIATLGFRGEALSSLCALSNLNVTTRHTSSEYATRVEYDNNGHIKSKTPCARQIGTTVTLTDLFSSLPVRHKEFIKNLRREFNKMCQLLYSYCLVSQGVRILCSNQTKKGARTTVVATQGSKTLKENIICVFGFKQFESLVEIKLHQPDQQILEDYNIKRSPDDTLDFTFEGFISKCSHGSGRSTSDRQFYYINSRPCEPTKCMKLVNEVYKYFNGNQYPFVYLNIKADQSQIDVNVTPDKRQIFMEKEKLLLATLKTSLLEIFKEFPCTLKMQNTTLSQPKESIIERNNKDYTEALKQWSKTKDDLLSSQKSRGVKRATEPETEKPKGIMNFIFNKRLKIEECTKPILTDDSASEDEDKQIEKFVKESFNSSDSEFDVSGVTVDPEIRNSLKDFQSTYTSYNKTKPVINTNEEANYKIQVKSPEYETKPIITNEETNACTYKVTLESPVIKTKEETSACTYKITLESPEHIKEKCTKLEEVIETITNSKNIEKIQPQISSSTLNNVMVDVNVTEIKDILNKMKSVKNENSQSETVKFRSELTSKDAESELQKQISKDMFEKMDIIGQFNKGFIIAKMDSDIFIIDQHASDEKYNFETLQRTTILQNQKLVNPKPLDLTAANELLLIDNLDIFTKNGFSFNINEEAEPRNKIALTAIPVSKNWHFGKEDIDELLFMLQEDSTYENIRPSRIRAMFASRACRKSVMVGSSLSNNDMRKLVDHMGQIDQPWNCPHGRPTMRHLINLNLIEEEK